MGMSNSDYSLSINATLDTSKVQKTYDELRNSVERKQLKIPIDVKIDDIMPQLNRNFTEFGQRLDESMQRIKTGLSSTVGEINGQLTNLIKTTETYKNKIGDVQERTSIWTEDGKLLASSLNTVQKGIEDINTTTTTSVDKVGEFDAKVTKVTKAIKDTDGVTKTVITTTKEWVDEEGNLNQQITTTDEKENQLRATITNVTNDSKKAAKVTRELAEEMNKLGAPKQPTITGTQTFIDKNGLKTIIEYNNQEATLVTTINKRKTATGELVEEITKEDAKTGEIISKNTKLLRDEQQLTIEAEKRAKAEKEKADALDRLNNGLSSKTTTTTQGMVSQFGDTSGQKYEAVVTTIREIDSAGKMTIKTIDEFTNAQGRLVKQMRTTDEYGKKVAQDTIEISSASKNAGSSLNNLNNSVDKTNKGLQGLNWSLSDAFRRLANFYLASLPIRAFQTAVTNAVQVVKDFDSAITEMGKVTDYSGEKLKAYTRDLADLGTEVARTQTEMTEAATGWLKAGYSEEDAALLSKYSALLQNTADEQISAADATSILVSQLKAYHMEAEEAIKVTDIINAVSAQQAVSSADISQGLTVASAAMATFGNSIEETTALLTAGTTIFQGRSSQVARGLNMIATRVAKNEEELAKYGVSINDSNGQLRSTYDILVDLAPAWNSMSKAEQVALGNTLAGTNQYKILAAIMSQMDVAVETYDQALNSSGETMKQNAVYMDSLEAKTTALKAEFEKLVISKGGLQDFAKSLIEIATEALKVVEALGGLPSILRVVTTLFIAINAVKIVEWFGSVYQGVTNLVYALPNAVAAWKSYAAGVVSANTAIAASIPIIGLVAAAISLLIGVISNHNRKVEEQKEKIKESIAAFSQEYESINQNIEKLKDESITREELNSIIEGNLDKYDAERLALLNDNDARKEAIKLLEDEKKARAEELVDTGLSVYEESLENLEKGYDEFDKFYEFKKEHYAKGFLEKAGMADAKTAKEQIDALKRYKQALIDARAASIERGTDKNNWGIKNLDKDIEKTEALISELSTKYKEDTENVKNFDDALNTLGKHYQKTTKEIVSGSNKSAIAIEEERKGRERLKETNKKSIQELDNLKKKYELTEDAIYDYMEAHAEENATYDDAVQALALEAEAQSKVVKSTEVLNKEYEDSLKATSSLVSSLSDLSSAFEEQEKNGSLSLSTQLKLIESGYALALVYDEETGACKLDEEAVKKLVEAKIQMQIANLEITRSDIISQLQAEGQAAVVAAGEFLALAKAKNLASAASLSDSNARGGYDPSKSYAGYGGNFGYLKNDTSQVDALNKEIEALDDLLQNVKTSGKDAFKSIGGAAKSAGGKVKDAAEEAKKALEETKKEYERVIKWITKQYDKKIDSIKKTKDEATKAIEKEIKALEKEKDTIIDNIEKETDALEKEKDARKKYWDDQIDALKKANQEKKDALELQEKLDALERARNTKVKIYKEGQGFVYDVDQTAVAEAQKELDEYLSEKAYEDELARLEALRDAELDNYEKRIDALNEYKDNVQKSYEEQIDALKAHKEALEEQYDAEIEMYQNYKQQFEDMVNAYEEQQDALLAAQLAGINIESDNWMTRLDNLAEFVRKYNELQKQLNTGNTGVSNNASMKGGNTSSSTTLSKNAKSTSTNTSVNIGGSSGTGNKGDKNLGMGGAGSYSGREGLQLSALEANRKRVLGYASGTPSIKDDQIAIVGENPNQEIVIGSKLNNGELMSLNKGTGVVNADSSSTLAGMLNQVGKFGASGFGSGNGTLNNNINNDSLTINGVTIEGANINDPQTFVNGLLSLKSDAIQRAYRHR